MNYVNNFIIYCVICTTNKSDKYQNILNAIHYQPYNPVSVAQRLRMALSAMSHGNTIFLDLPSDIIKQILRGHAIGTKYIY